MSALSAGTPRKMLSSPALVSYPMADNVIIYQGGIVMINASNLAIPGATATGSIGVGVCSSGPQDLDRYDNTVTGHAAGMPVRVYEGVFCLKNGSGDPFLSTTLPGVIAWIEDDQTVGVTSTGKSPAGLFHHLDADGVWVTMGQMTGAYAAVLSTVTDASAAHLAGAETFTGAKTFGAGVVASGSVANDFSGGTGTFKTSSGQNTLSGDVALAANKNFVPAAGTGAIDLHLATGAAESPTSTTNFWKWNQRQSAGSTTNAITAATGAAIPVTSSGSLAITQNGAETNTLADPTFRGQWLDIFVDTDTSGARVITAASRINQAANTIITMTEVGDFISLRAITIAGALKWQVVANDGAVLS